MNTIELQNSLIRKILNTKDFEVLDYFNNMLTAEAQAIYKLNEYEIEVINESLADYKSGNVISNTDVFAKTEKWLNEPIQQVRV